MNKNTQNSIIMVSNRAEKDFDGWNNEKKRTHYEPLRFYTVREIWWCRIGINVGTEVDGKGDRFLRPCVISRAFGKDACLIVPLTTSVRQHPLRVPVGLVQENEARANISQIRVIDTRRLVEKVGFLPKPYFHELKKRIKTLF